jgi:predicted transcriptional regulator
MKLRDVKEILNAELIAGNDSLDREVDYAFSSDLMSDVLAYVKKHTLLLTGLSNAQVIRTAEMIDLKAILFVRNKRPAVEIIDLAKENNMVIMSTEHTLYTASGKLYNHGLQGINICE